jgi:hypothetical protein
MATTPQHAVKVTPAVVAQRFAMVHNAPTAPTLNGKPAHVSGFANRFATVTDHTTGLSGEWSWETVEHVMNNRFAAFKA